jgi:hypothetical protein
MVQPRSRGKMVKQADKMKHQAYEALVRRSKPLAKQAASRAEQGVPERGTRFLRVSDPMGSRTRKRRLGV